MLSRSSRPSCFRSLVIVLVGLLEVTSFVPTEHRPSFTPARSLITPRSRLFASVPNEEKDVVLSSATTKNATTKKPRLSRPERKALERQKKNEPQRSSKPKYSLHSNAVSQLTESSTADEVTRAIKRAQKNHDHHDLQVVADFLIGECNVGFAYGYRGSLLARLAVAALHFGNHKVARRAIDIRRMGE